MRDEKDQPACVQLILSRRRFLQGMTVSAALAPFLSACEFAELKDVEVVDGVEFDLSQPEFSALESIGGLAIVKAGSIDILLVRADDDSVFAFDRYCSHQGEDMGPAPNPLPAVWDADEQTLICRWHNSRFDGRGETRDNSFSNIAIQIYEVDFDPATGRGRVIVFGGDET